MNLQGVSLSLYSFGYSAGFVRDDRPEAAAPQVTLENLSDLARKHGLGGIEFPVDRYFPKDALAKADLFLEGLRQKGTRVTLDVENFDPIYLRALLPFLRRNGLGFARIKMSGFYGGNRYQQPDFREAFRTFIRELRSLIPELRKERIRLLIENHQDLGVDDLLEVIQATSPDCVGINWDIGNSLAVLDTPESFLRKAGRWIGNVHLKDYRLFRALSGFYLSRCALGEGAVDFGPLLSELAQQGGTVPMTIELGAQTTRRADIFQKAYWEAYPPQAVSEVIPFFSFLNHHLLDGEGWKTPWERGLPGREIIEQEMAQIQRSVRFLQGIELGHPLLGALR